MKKHLATAGLAVGSLLLVGGIAAEGNRQWTARVTAEQVAARDAAATKDTEISQLRRTLQVTDTTVAKLRAECLKGDKAYALTTTLQKTQGRLQKPAC